MAKKRARSVKRKSKSRSMKRKKRSIKAPKQKLVIKPGSCGCVKQCRGKKGTFFKKRRSGRKRSVKGAYK